ncbi:MAG: hypothetical protein N2482_03355 [Patescibacteria group bacterium]|nr:hypothetical protein [Patescibacteria group bacterium]
MKITVYTVSDCQFSKQEKEYLQAHNLPFEEKNLEQNKEWLTEMLAVSNNFAGTPVTKIEKDDGTIIVLKGFTPEEFDNTLGFQKEAKEDGVQTNAQVDIPPSSLRSTSEQPATTPSPAPPQTSQIPTPPTSTTSTPQPPDPLTSVLENLQEKTNQPQPPTTDQPPVNQPPPPSNLPNIPDFNDKT